MRIRWSDSAQRDVAEMRRFIAARSPNQAESDIRRIHEAVRRLKEFPLSGRVVPEAGLENLREVVLPPFRIVYTVQTERVSIVAVFHSSRAVN